MNISKERISQTKQLLRNTRGVVKRVEASKRSEWRRKRVKLQKGLCFYCGQFMKAPTLDHLTPLSKGGADHWENTCAACDTCNQDKGQMCVKEYVKMRRNMQVCLARHW